MASPRAFVTFKTPLQIEEYTHLICIPSSPWISTVIAVVRREPSCTKYLDACGSIPSWWVYVTLKESEKKHIVHHTMLISCDVHWFTPQIQFVYKKQQFTLCLRVIDMDNITVCVDN